MSRVVFLNDKKIYNERYRRSTIDFFNQSGFETLSLGIFENPFKVIFIILFSKNIISSNMKSNILLLLFFFKKKVCIINGLGRHRYNKFFRFALICLLKLNYKSSIIFQNYADLRYFSHFVKSNRFILVHGSGATKRSVSKCNNVFVVCREGKFNYVKKDIYNASCSLNKRFKLVGMDLSNEYVNGVGYVNQSNIFTHGSVLYVPDGYGEGIPHVLVDAIFSECSILISKRQLISYGFYKMAVVTKVYEDKYLLCNFTNDIKKFISPSVVNKKIYKALFSNE